MTIRLAGALFFYTGRHTEGQKWRI